jgi:hypothetical protein
MNTKKPLFQSQMLITVARYIDPLQAHIVKGRLEAEGIVTSIAYEHHVWVNWFISNALGFVRLQVPTAAAEDALELLQRIANNEYALLLEEQFGAEALICPKCQGSDTVRYRFSERLALLVLGLLHAPLPFETGRYICNHCGFSWISQEGKAYSRSLLFTVICVEIGLIALLLGLLQLLLRRYTWGYIP